MALHLRPYKGIHPKLGEKVYIDPQATVIGEVELGEDVSVWPGAVIRGDMHWIKIGSRSNVQDNAVIHTTHASEEFNPAGFPTSIGEDVTIGHSAVLHGCTVEDKVLIGIGAIINDGVTIKSGAMVGAGSVVPPGKTLEGGYVYIGNPAKQLRELSEPEKKFLGYSPQNYIKLKNQYLLDQSDQ